MSSKEIEMPKKLLSKSGSIFSIYVNRDTSKTAFIRVFILLRISINFDKLILCQKSWTSEQKDNMFILTIVYCKKGTIFLFNSQKTIYKKSWDFFFQKFHLMMNPYTKNRRHRYRRFEELLEILKFCKQSDFIKSCKTVLILSTLEMTI